MAGSSIADGILMRFSPMGGNEPPNRRNERDSLLCDGANASLAALAHLAPLAFLAALDVLAGLDHLALALPTSNFKL